MIHLSAIDASRLLGNNPKAKAVVNKVKKAQQAVSYTHLTLPTKA